MAETAISSPSCPQLVSGGEGNSSSKIGVFLRKAVDRQGRCEGRRKASYRKSHKQGIHEYNFGVFAEGKETPNAKTEYYPFSFLLSFLPLSSCPFPAQSHGFAFLLAGHDPSNKDELLRITTCSSHNCLSTPWTFATLRRATPLPYTLIAIERVPEKSLQHKVIRVAKPYEWP